METTPKTSIGILVILAILAVLLLSCAFCASTVPLFYGQIRNAFLPVSGPSGNVQISELEQRVISLEQDQKYTLREISWALDQKLYYIAGAALFISSLSAFFGWKTYKDLDGIIRTKIRVAMDNELYKLDPANLTVRVPKNHPDREKIEKRLRTAGLKNLKEYTELSDQCRIGVTIVPIDDSTQENDYADFLARTKPDTHDSAFVLYVTTGYKISLEVISMHDRAATANMPSTVLTAILAISRGLHIDRPIPDSKEDL